MRSTDLILVTILTWSLNEATTIYKEVLINAMASISCIPNKNIQIQWLRIPPGGSKDNPDYVYAGGRFYVSSERNFRLEKDSNTGPYHLIIPNAKLEDAGLYECKEDTGSLVFGSTQLTVLGSSPVCGSDMKPQGYVGRSTCNLKQEDMTFTCAVSFNGTHPQVTWKNLNGSQSFDESARKNETGRITSILIIKADSMYDETVFNCQSTRSSVNCSTELIKIQYFDVDPQKSEVMVKNVSDRINCSVKSNQILRYKWTRLQGNQYVTFVENQELLIKSPGFYQCVVEYRIRNAECVAYGSEVNVPDPSTPECATEPAVKAALTTAEVSCIVLAIGLLLLIAVIVGFYLYRRHEKRKKRKKYETESFNKSQNESDGGDPN